MRFLKISQIFIGLYTTEKFDCESKNRMKYGANLLEK